MKKLVLAASIAALGATSANAAPKVYGKAFLTFDYVMEEEGAAETTSTKLNSNASRIGFKGKENLGNGLAAIYKAEYQIDMDAGDDVFKQRNIYAGLSSDRLGTLLGGKMDTPVKTSQKKVDLFSDYAGLDMKYTLAGEDRASNMIAYMTPKASGMPVALTLGVTLDEEPKADNSTEDRDHGFHAKAAYNDNGLYAAIAGAWDSKLKDKLNGERGDIVRLVGQYKVGNAQLGALYQMAESDQSSFEQNAWLLSAKYKVAGTPFTVKGQFQSSKNEANGANDIDVTQYTLGGEYKLGKSTKAIAYFGNRSTDYNTTGKDDKTWSSIGTGLVHKF